MKKVLRTMKPEENIQAFLQETSQVDLLFRILQKDTIGNSSSNPTWGYVYSCKNKQLRYQGIGLFKEYDYDLPYAAFSEKIWSIMGQEIIGDIVRVPKIDVVEEEKNLEGIISYRLMNNDTEDMIHINDILYNQFSREEIYAKKDIISLNSLLECVQLQVKDKTNYQEIEKAMIYVLLLDAITNNGDRHLFNWALVRSKSTNHYDLAVFDHAGAFMDMFIEQPGKLVNGWNSSYVTTKEGEEKRGMGSIGNRMIEYIQQNYESYFNDFFDRYIEKLPLVLQKIQKENLPINVSRLEAKLTERKRFLKKLKDKGEHEYE